MKLALAPSAGGSAGGAESTAEEPADATGEETAAGAELLLELADATVGLKGGGATGSFFVLSRVPDMTCALIDCGGGKYPALCPKLVMA